MRRELERAKGIEPSSQPWEGRVLPLNHTRSTAAPSYHRASVVYSSGGGRRRRVPRTENRCRIADMAGPIPSLRFEKEAWNAGAYWVAGVDEVGVGPLAGPVAAAVVALPAGRRFRWYSSVRDSKVMSEAHRRDLAPRIRSDGALGYRLGLARGDRPDRHPPGAAALHAPRVRAARRPARRDHLRRARPARSRTSARSSTATR